MPSKPPIFTSSMTVMRDTGAVPALVLMIVAMFHPIVTMK